MSSNSLDELHDSKGSPHGSSLLVVFVECCSEGDNDSSALLLLAPELSIGENSAAFLTLEGPDEDDGEEVDNPLVLFCC